MKRPSMKFVCGLLCAGMLLLVGCSADAPVGPVSDNAGQTVATGLAGTDDGSQARTVTAVDAASIELARVADSYGVTLMTLPASARTKPTVSVTKFVKASVGGYLYGRMSYLTTKKDSCVVWASILIPPGALTKDETITMSFDKSYALVDFGPHGLTFAKSAVVLMSVRNATPPPSGTSAQMLYVDDFSAPQPTSFAAKYDSGTNTYSSQLGLLDHFSRYAFGF